MYLLCADVNGQGGGLTRSKLEPLPDSEKVSKLREKVAGVTQKEASSFNLIYCGKILDDDRTLSSYGIKSSSSVQLMPKTQQEVTKVAPVPTTDENVQQFMLAFGMAVRNPNFTKIASKASKNLGDLCASVPGLDQDPVACAFLSKPELMLSLLHPETFKYVAEKHPGLIEVANNLAALILESKTSDKDSDSQSSGMPNPFAYHLDEMSDDEEFEDMEMDPQAGPSTGGAGQPFQPISAEQLRAALNAATAGAQSLFGGVTGMGPTAPPPSMPPNMSLGAAGTSSSSQMQSPITQDQLAAALAAATGGTLAPPSTATAAASANPFSFGAPPQSADPSAAAGNNSWDQEVAKMKEMGISDEGLARKALQIMGGDLQAAIELIFSGWDGMDDSAN